MRNKIKRILAAVMAAGMTLSVIPSITTYAAQSNEYVDPADVWIEANGRTSEFDINATVTTGTMFCPVCDMPTSNISYRVPELAKPHIIAASTIRTVRLLTEKAKAILTTEHPALTRSIRGIIGQNQFVRIAVR